jgi:hypothetical protein
MKAIVFSQFWMHVQLIAAELTARGVRHVLLKGDMPARDKQAAVTSFRAARSPCCMVMDESGGPLCFTQSCCLLLLQLCTSDMVLCMSSTRVVLHGQEEAGCCHKLQGCAVSLLHGDGRVRWATVFLCRVAVYLCYRYVLPPRSCVCKGTEHIVFYGPGTSRRLLLASGLRGLSAAC